MNTPIGILDSGIGGLTIWSSIRQLLPYEPFVYFSDNAQAPYGSKSPEFISARVTEVVTLLLDWDVKLCVIACNTATTNAISQLRKHFDIPFVGVEPAIKPAAALTRTGKIGVLATAGTLSSPLYRETARMYASNAEVVTVIGSGLVEWIEQGDWEAPELLELLSGYLLPFRKKEIDVLVLGCTHYPFLEKAIRAYFPYPVHIVNSSDAVSRHTQNLLIEKGLLHQDFSLSFLGYPGYANGVGHSPAPWLESRGVEARFLTETNRSAGVFLSSGPIDALTRALDSLGHLTDPV